MSGRFRIFLLRLFLLKSLQNVCPISTHTCFIVNSFLFSIFRKINRFYNRIGNVGYFSQLANFLCDLVNQLEESTKQELRGFFEGIEQEDCTQEPFLGWLNEKENVMLNLLAKRVQDGQEIIPDGKKLKRRDKILEVIIKKSVGEERLLTSIRLDTMTIRELILEEYQFKACRCSK
jgi:hypothetical protein